MWTVGLLTALLALGNTVVYSLPSELAKGLSLVVPANFPLCISAILTAHLIRWVYEWNVKIIQFRL